MNSKHARKISEEAFNQLVEAVEAGKSQKLTEYLKTMGQFHNYSLGNAILIGFQRPDATHVAGLSILGVLLLSKLTNILMELSLGRRF